MSVEETVKPEPEIKTATILSFSQKRRLDTPEQIQESVALMHQNASFNSEEEEVAEIVVDKATLETVEEILASVKAGRIKGIAVIGWNPEDQIFGRWITLPPNRDLSTSAFHFKGALTLLDDALADCAMIEGGYISDEDDLEGEQ